MSTRITTHVLALCAAALPIAAQDAGAVPRSSSDHRILLHHATFDPLIGVPEVPPALQGGADTNLWIVQFPAPPDDGERAAVRATGARIHGFLPQDAYVVEMNATVAATVRTLPVVRWVGPYHPAYRLEGALVAELLSGQELPVRRCNMVMLDKRRDKRALELKITALGGKVYDRHIGGLLFTAELNGPQLAAAARLDEVLWIDRWTPPGDDMNNARIQCGANTVEALAGYTGQGIRGHIWEGCENNHPDFTVPLTNVLSGGEAYMHGHCTAGIVFGNGTSHANARGMIPDAVGFYTTHQSTTVNTSRNQVISEVVNQRHCMFTTASWGATPTPAYTAISADADDIVFDHFIPWTQSMSNNGNTDARPEAWAKNVISIGGVYHQDNSNPLDDTWSNSGSIGPAQDGRNKPDLCAYYDEVWTSDLSVGGYNNAGGVAGQSTTSFSGTSSATPIVAGLNGLAIQMYTDGVFGNPLPLAPTLANRFANRPRAQTLKALQIVCAEPYNPAPINNRREHVGWGLPNVGNMYSRRDKIWLVPENVPIRQGNTHTYVTNVRAGETRLKVCLTWLDPAANPAAAFDRVNDLTLKVIAPNGTQYWGNVGMVGPGQANVSTAGGAANGTDTVECVFIANPAAGNWTIEVTAPVIATDAHLPTAAVDATYALAVNGGIRLEGSGCARYFPDVSPTGGGNLIPFGCTLPLPLTTLFAANNQGNIGGTVFFNVTVQNPLWLCALDVNSALVAGNEIFVDVYRTAAAGGHVGRETNPAAWLPMTAGRGTAAGVNVATHMRLNQPFLLPAGTHGIALVARNFMHQYTNGTGLNQNYSDANLGISLGSAVNGTFSGTVNLPRVANTTLYYRLDNSQWVNQRYQTVLRTSDLGSAGRITGLAFSAQSPNNHWNSSLLIRMSHLPANTALSTTFANNLPAPVTVLDATNHTVHMRGNDWTEIGLRTPFNYNGTSDVVVDITAMGNHISEPGQISCNSGGIERVYAYGWTGMSPLAGTASSSSGLRLRVSFNCASADDYGFGCGPGYIDHTGSGARGTWFAFHVHDVRPVSAAVIALGLNNGVPFPMSLASYGFRNCFAWNDGGATLLYMTDPTGFAQHLVQVPASSALDGLKVNGQWYVLDATQPGGLTATAQTRVTVGLDP